MYQQARISVTLFHASTTTGLDRLDPAASHDRHVFGPAIYATKDRSVAECQHDSIQAIYQIKATGPVSGIIELNQVFNFQEERAKKAISTVIRRFKLSRQPDNGNPMANWLAEAAMELKERGVTYPARTLINRTLADEGIWLLRGMVSGIETTLPQDNGIQWAILNADHIEVLAEQPRYLPLSSLG